MFAASCRNRFRAGSRQAGFSLVELLVSLVVMAVIMIGVGIMFDRSSKLARAQTHVAEIQQSLRVGQSELVRFVRMAGIGGLPITRLNLPAGEPSDSPPNYDLLGAFPRSGYAVSVLNNVDEGTIIQVVTPSSTAAADQVMPGSDVLILRGVMTTPLYYFDPPRDISGWGWEAPPVVGRTVTIADRVRVVGGAWEDFPQDVAALGTRLLAAKNQPAANRPVALILRDTLNPNAYLIMEFDAANTQSADLAPSAGTCPPRPPEADAALCIKFGLRIDPDSEPGTSYGKLISGTSLQSGPTLELPDGSDPPDLGPFLVPLPTNIGSIGLLEEFRFFIRAEYEIRGNTASRLTPVLSRAEFLPGTDVMINRVDIADNVIDLQIAIGADVDPAGNPGHGLITENDTGAWVADEILGNEPGDTDGITGNFKAPPLSPNPPAAPAVAAVTWYDPELEYHFLRINTLVQSRLPDRDHRSPVLTAIEDYNRGDSFEIDGVTYELNNDLTRHRRWLQTVVELRNLL